MSHDRIAYVLKMYPRFSETFIVSEFLGREAEGADIEVFSLRPPVDPRFHAALADVQAPVTYVAPARKAEEIWQVLREAACESARRARPDTFAGAGLDVGLDGLVEVGRCGLVIRVDPPAAECAPRLYGDKPVRTEVLAGLPEMMGTRLAEMWC